MKVETESQILQFSVSNFNPINFPGISEGKTTKTYWSARVSCMRVTAREEGVLRWEGGSPFYGPPPERGSFFRLEVYKRVGKRLLVRVIGVFEKSRVREIRIPPYFSYVSQLFIIIFLVSISRKFIKLMSCCMLPTVRRPIQVLYYYWNLPALQLQPLHKGELILPLGRFDCFFETKVGNGSSLL